MPKGVYIRTEKHKGRTGKNSNAWKGGKIEVVCQLPECNKTREVYQSQIDQGRGKYHNRKCYMLSKKGKKPETGGKRSEKSGFQKGHKINCGRHNPEAGFKKGHKINVGRIHTESSKRNMSECKKGKKKPPRSEEHKRKIREANVGSKRTEEQKTKLSEAMTGIKKPPFTEEHKRKIREATIRLLSSGKMPIKNTSIELKIEEELKRVNLNFQKQVAICKVGVVDFFLPDYDVIINCDGDYWHNRPKVKKRDSTQDLIYSLNGYKVFRFWEHEINESPKKCIKKVLRYVQLNNSKLKCG